MGLVATTTALLLGLLIHAAQVTNDSVRTQLDQGAASMLELDRALGVYGPEAARLLTPQGVAVARLAEGFDAAGRAAFMDSLDALEPQTEAQRATLARVTGLLNTAGRPGF